MNEAEALIGIAGIWQTVDIAMPGRDLADLAPDRCSESVMYAALTMNLAGAAMQFPRLIRSAFQT